MTASPVETVKSLFQSFGAGDLPAVLSLLADDVVWSGGKADLDVPTHVERRGRAEVPKFFEGVAVSRSSIASSRAVSSATAAMLSLWCTRSSPSGAPASASRWTCFTTSR
jgi:ketosteroid isomerase-like protein